MKLSEITRIKLGGKKNNNTDLFMNELNELTTDHPYDNRSRILNNTTVEISPFGGMIHISDIRSLLPNSGAGTETMKLLMALADKHNVKLHLVAKAYSKDKKYITDTEKLVLWYRKLGFTIDDEIVDDWSIENNDFEGYESVEMVYHPK